MAVFNSKRGLELLKSEEYQFIYKQDHAFKSNLLQPERGKPTQIPSGASGRFLVGRQRINTWIRPSPFYGRGSVISYRSITLPEYKVV